MTRRHRNELGVTLVELMIAMVITSIAIAAALGVGYSMMNGNSEQRRAVKVERSTRASLQYIAKMVRAASPAMPDGKVNEVLGSCAGDQPTITVTNSSTGPDELELIYGTGIVTFLTVDFALNPLGGAFDVANSAGFSQGDWVVLSNGATAHLFEVTDVPTTTTIVIDSGTCPLPANLPVGDTYLTGTPVILVEKSRIIVEPTTFGGSPTLAVALKGSGSFDPVAEGIEDMQLAAAVDTNEDGTLQEVGTIAADDEWTYNVAGEGPADITVTPTWRALRITLVGRSVTEAQSSGGTSLRPDAEDHSGSVTGDGYKRRTFSSTIELRNLEGSP